MIIITYGFDPKIILNTYIARLTIIEKIKNDLPNYSGNKLAVSKAVGRYIMERIKKTRENMERNEMWIQETPIGERRYLYSLSGRNDQYQISQDDLDFYITMERYSVQDYLRKNREHPD